MKNMTKQIHFCGPGQFLVSFVITPGQVKMLLYIFAYFQLSQVRQFEDSANYHGK